MRAEPRPREAEGLADGAVPLIAGGGHSISLPILRAVASKSGRVSLVQCDAHIDKWGDYLGGKYYHGSSFRRAIEKAFWSKAASCNRATRA